MNDKQLKELYKLLKKNAKQPRNQEIRQEIINIGKSIEDVEDRLRGYGRMLQVQQDIYSRYGQMYAAVLGSIWESIDTWRRAGY